MERRNFLKGSALVTGAALTGQATAGVSAQEKELYEWRVYRYKNNGQKEKVGQFYVQALIPAMNRYGVKVGAFEEYGQTEPPTGYYLLVYPSLTAYSRTRESLWGDKPFLEKAAPYFEETAENGAFLRYDTFLLEAFDAIPRMRMPGKDRSLFELRLYESNQEEAGQRKISMFNKEELALFDDVGLHATFFGEILAGPQMPGLLYMLWFRDMGERDENWKKFRGSPRWREMSNKPAYAHTVSVVNKRFLVPAACSQI
ncbi:MAG: NIPSNAP family protein [Mangrovibacterium sp.]|nr:NIPSNAP family protein [Mangrovibacterium sp.]